MDSEYYTLPRKKYKLWEENINVSVCSKYFNVLYNTMLIYVKAQNYKI